MGARFASLGGAVDDSPICRVQQLLSSPEWQSLNSASQPFQSGRDASARGLSGGALRRLELIVAARLPPMMVLPAPRLAELGFIPKNSDAAAATVVDARAALRDEHAVLMLVSHRWLRPREGEPDDARRTKARALVAFARWYELGVGAVGDEAEAPLPSLRYELKYPARRLFFWIDYTCIPFDNRATGIAALPAFVAACTDMLCFETPDYHRRAWCRLERAVAYAFLFSRARVGDEAEAPLRSGTRSSSPERFRSSCARASRRPTRRSRSGTSRARCSIRARATSPSPRTARTSTRCSPSRRRPTPRKRGAARRACCGSERTTTAAKPRTTTTGATSARAR